MPIMTGAEALRAIRALRPDACVLMMSGYNELEATPASDPDNTTAFLHKPFTLLMLRERLQEVMGGLPR
jgi:CheY-like chemotaxis protein